MSTKNQNLSAYNLDELPSAKDMNIGIVVAEWNSKITRALETGAVETLRAKGIAEDHLVRITVPGSFELPSGAQLLLEKHNLDAVIILGCVIQGETRHFDFICQGVTQGIMDLSINYKKPVIFGLLTTDNVEQAEDRAGGKHGNKGVEAAVTALKMVELWRQGL
jgi:6,7-dimethyl-8-ribityllumazine synthase